MSIRSSDIAEWCTVRYAKAEETLDQVANNIARDPEQYILQRVDTFPENFVMWDATKKRPVTVTYAFIVRHTTDLDTGNFVPKGQPLPANLTEGARKDTPSAGAQVSVTYDLTLDSQFVRYLRVVEAWAKHDPAIDSETMDRSKWMTPDWVAESRQYTASSQLFQKRSPFNSKYATDSGTDGIKGGAKASGGKGKQSAIGLLGKGKGPAPKFTDEADREDSVLEETQADSVDPTGDSNRPKELKYEVHNWIKKATAPNNPQWIPNPARVLFFERLDKKQIALAKSDLPRLRGGDLVKAVSKFGFTIATGRWGMTLSPMHIIRVVRGSRESQSAHGAVQDDEELGLHQEGDVLEAIEESDTEESEYGTRGDGTGQEVQIGGSELDFDGNSPAWGALTPDSQDEVPSEETNEPSVYNPVGNEGLPVGNKKRDYSKVDSIGELEPEKKKRATKSRNGK